VRTSYIEIRSVFLFFVMKTAKMDTRESFDINKYVIIMAHVT